jgi:hypothetical protein
LALSNLFGVVHSSLGDFTAVNETAHERHPFRLPGRRIYLIANLFGVEIAEQGMPMLVPSPWDKRDVVGVIGSIQRPGTSVVLFRENSFQNSSPFFFTLAQIFCKRKSYIRKNL